MGAGEPLTGGRRASEVHVLGAALLLAFLVMWALNPDRFLTAANLRSMGCQLPELGLLSLAMMVTMVSGGIDLSIVSASNLAGIVAAMVSQSLLGAPASGAGAVGGTAVALVAGLSASLLVGLVNGWLAGAAGVSPILATLGTMHLVAGLGLVLTGGGSISGLPATIGSLGNGLFCGVPVPLWIFGASAMALDVVMRRTPWGFRLHLLGANPTATLFSGVNNRHVLLLAYALSGLLSGLAGIVMIARFNSARAGYGESYLLIAILAAVLGGTSPTGGFGRVSGTVLALAILQVLSSGLNLLRVSAFLTAALWGLTILAVMGLNRAVERWRVAAPSPTAGCGPSPLGQRL